MGSIGKFTPIVLPLIHALISGLGNRIAQPIAIVAGWETYCLILAVLAATGGTILGFLDLSTNFRVIFVVASIFGAAAAFLGYSIIIVRGGANNFQLALLLFLYILIYLFTFYVLTQFERLMAGLIKSKPSKRKR